MLALDAPLVLATGQSVVFSMITIMRTGNGIAADVMFDVLDSQGVKVGFRRLNYAGTAFNAFWAAFNSGKYLYDEAVAKLGFAATTTAAVEDDFVNVVHA